MLSVQGDAAAKKAAIIMEKARRDKCRFQPAAPKANKNRYNYPASHKS